MLEICAKDVLGYGFTNTTPSFTKVRSRGPGIALWRKNEEAIWKEKKKLGENAKSM